MSEAFYERFLSLFFGFVVLLTLILATVELFLFYFSTQNIAFYYAYLTMLLFCLVCFVRYLVQFRGFQETLRQGLLFPSHSEEPTNLDVLKTDSLEDASLKACLFYRNGASLNNIAREFGFNHPTQARRELRKGLHILLQSYEKHEKFGGGDG